MRSSKSEDVVVWVRLPKGFPADQAKKIGLHSSVCHGGDTCICAPAFTDKAGIVLQGPKDAKIQDLIKKAGFVPQAKCFGGDTCIV